MGFVFMMGHILLTESDLENIILWYQRAFQQKDDCEQSDKNTFTKLQALLIVEEETEDSFRSTIGRLGR